MKPVLRWWLFVCFSVAVMAVAGMFGFYRDLWLHDASYLGFVVIGLYLACTVALLWKVRTGDTDYGYVEHVAKKMSYLGILGTFIGLTIAFQAMYNLPADGTIPPAFKAEFMQGIATKFLTSIVGLVGWLMLDEQVAILKMGRRDA